MKKIIGFIVILFSVHYSMAQKVNNSVSLKDLAVPNSPAFIITDITPSLIQTPNTPKSFVLGLAQSFQQSSDGFPQNYSAEFAPYWWLKPQNRNVYTMVGLKTVMDANKQVISIKGGDPFSGLKFTSFSLAFLNKDMVPDTIKVNQKIFSIGVRTTVLKYYMKSHAENLKNKISEWHEAAQKELEIYQEAITRADPKKQAEMLKQLANFKPSGTSTELKEINDIINEKPIFSLDVAGAYAIYGIGDSAWKSGRSGIWTTLSSYIPLALGGEKINKNYFNLNFSLRYLFDNYHKDAKGIISKNRSIDLGGKIAIELDKFSIGIESLYRFNNGVANSQNRTVGIINYKVADNIYITGAFGKNFENPNKLISLFGINWGFGSETVNLPATK
ncbi:MAG: hypothetical protein ABI685_14265 [Ferruginibacter sp.]